MKNKVLVFYLSSKNSEVDSLKIDFNVAIWYGHF